MIYDLKNMGELGCLQIDALLAIAERLEGLAEAQNANEGRRLVEFECANSTDSFAVMPRKVYCVEVDMNGITLLRTLYGERLVKGTLAEVLAKLRGDK